MRNSLEITFALLLLSFSVAAGEDELAYPQALKERGLKTPIDVTYATIYKDGGTRGATLVGANGVKVDICIDGGMNSKTEGRLFIGALHPKREGAEIAKRGRGTENAFAHVLQTWLDERYTRELQDAWRNYKTTTNAEGHHQANCVLKIVDNLTKAGQKR